MQTTPVKFPWITLFLIVIAVLAYLGKSLVMLTSVAGMAIGIGVVRKHSLGAQVIGCTIGALVAGLLAEVVHVVHHRFGQDIVDHGGFWFSAVTVSLINSAVMVPALWLSQRLGRSRQRSG